MLTPTEYRKCFGTTGAVAPARNISLGQLSFALERDGLRRLAWRDTEIVRGISLVLRDENWGGIQAGNTTDALEIMPDSFRLTRRIDYLNGALDAVLDIVATGDGAVDCTVNLTANSDIMVNRAGFTILHPVIGVAGFPVRVRHGNGDHEDLHFPRLIAPAQPIFDIAGLSHQIASTEVSFEFEGEVFEMEDQRNWSDASFKTYCRALELPFPFRINKGEVMQQAIRLRVTEIAEIAGTKRTLAQQPKPAVTRTGQAPEILLAAECGWQYFHDQPASGYVLRLGHGHECSLDYLNSLANLVHRSGAYMDVELIIDAGSDATAQFEIIATLLERGDISPRQVIALPDTYLKSHQPTGPWPAGLTPDDCAATAKKFFPDAWIGQGSLTNFTELNRCRPQPGTGDYITHANAAIVHAADDCSVIETLEALPQVFASGWSIAGSRGYRLGLMAIGMRTNPYGAKLSDNPQNIRKTMTADDPRQRGLFGAAYAIGVAVRAVESGIEAVALAGLGGPFSTHDQEILFPIFHAVKALSALAGRDVEPMQDLPTGVTGLRFDAGVIVANCSPDPVELTGLPAKLAVLDVTQFEAASRDADWLSNALEPASGALTLGAFGCLFADKEAIR